MRNIVRRRRSLRAIHGPLESSCSRPAYTPLIRHLQHLLPDFVLILGLAHLTSAISALETRIEQIAQETGNELALSVFDYETNLEWSRNGDRWLHSASTIKVAVLRAAEQEDQRTRFLAGLAICHPQGRRWQPVPMASAAMTAETADRIAGMSLRSVESMRHRRHWA